MADPTPVTLERVLPYEVFCKRGSLGRLIAAGPGAVWGIALMERRQTPRLKVQFRSSFSAPKTLEGDGMVVDLSQTGCRIATLVQVPSGTHLVVQLMLPDDLPPITVQSCIVRWSRNHEFGVQFLEVREKDRARLSRLSGKI